MLKAVVDRKELEAALRVLGRIAPTHTSIPAISQGKLVANGAVELYATDLERSAALTVERRGGRGGFELLFPMHLLARALRTFDGERVTLEPDAAGLRVDGEVTVTPATDISDWPAMPFERGAKHGAEIDGPSLARAIRSVAFVVSGEVVRYALTGVLLEYREGRFAAVASDGKRLAVARAEGAADKPYRVIIPSRAVESLLDIVRAGDGPVKLRVAEAGEGGAAFAQAEFWTARGRLHTRLVDGNFPDWEAVRPAFEPGDFWTVDRAKLSKALARVSVATTDATRAVRFRFSSALGKLELLARTQDVGKAEATVSAWGAPERYEAVFNPDFVSDYLKSLPEDADVVRVALGDKGSASLWRAKGGADYVLMPLTVNIA